LTDDIARVNRRIPRTIGALKAPTAVSGLTEAKATRSLQAAIHAVTFRYMEYCITAPLLFLAVVTLLTVDAPAW
jgi:hypothetical protein